MTPDDWPRQITDLIAEKLFVAVDSPRTDLFETGLVDSTGFVELVLGIEERFGVQIDLEQIEIADFRSVASIAELVSRRVAAAAQTVVHST